MEGEAGAAQVSQEGAPAIRALGSRFKVSEVFLWENSEGSLQRNPSPIAKNDGLTDESCLSQRFTEVGADVGSHTGVLLSSEEMELTKQMSALGLPIAFSTNQEKRNVKAKVRRKGSRGQLVGCLAVSAITYKYWCQRYLLFSKFNEGIKMDEEGWFSVTPELIAEHHALKCSGGTIIDCFAGVGGNAIQFAMRCDHVVAIDIDQQKVEHARHNAKIYGVDENIDFVKGDFFCLAPKLKGDMVYLSPPWGGPEYSKVDTYDLRTMLKPQNGYVLFKVAMEIAPRVVMFLPRNVDLNQLAEISLQVNPPWTLEAERDYLNGKLKAITAYFTKPS